MAVFKSNEKTKDGRCWFYKTYKNGRPYCSRKFATKTEAKEAEAVFILRRDNPMRKKLSLIAIDYFEHMKANYKLSTYDSRFRDYSNHIAPVFGDMDVSSINVPLLREWCDTVSKKGYSYNFKDKLYSTFSGLLDFAVVNYGLPDNPLKKLPRFKRRDDEVVKDKDRLRYLTVDQFNKFISCVSDETYNVFFYTGFMTGCRKGELVALTWDDIDFNSGVISINKTLYSKIKDRTGEDAVITSTKTGNNRRIQMSSSLCERLQNYKNKIKHDFSDFEESWFVFGNGTYLTNTSIDRHKDMALKEAELPHVTMHELCRHSHVSNLINLYLQSGQTDTTKFFIMCSARLGHSLEVMERTYLHLFPTVQNEIVDLLDKL